MDVDQTSRNEQFAAVGALGDELRRGMYAFIRRAGAPVSRDEAAAAVGISRKLAAFHLDKLVEVGLLRTRYDAPGRPRGVGRAPKLYELTDTQIALTVPPRSHDLLAALLLEGVRRQAPGRTAAEAVLDAAAEHGAQLGRDERARTRPGRLGPERALTACEHTLAAHGYEPVRESPTRITLRNCPFHPFAVQDPGLVCALNHAFLAGYLDGLEAPGVHAHLAPRPGRCCVTLSGSDAEEAEAPTETCCEGEVE